MSTTTLQSPPAPASPPATLGLKVLRVATIGALFGVFWLLLATQPRTGTLAIRCVDIKTGAPLAHAHVSIDAEPTDQSTDEYSVSNTDHSLLGGAQAPYGWAEGTKNDGSEATVKIQTTFSGRTDDQGRVTITSVPVGNYSINVDRRGYQEANYQHLEVTPEDITPLTAEMDKAPPSLNFNNTEGCWIPNEPITVGLSGDLANPAVSMQLRRVDIDTAVKKAPSALLSSLWYDQDNQAALGGGIAVRQWNVKIDDIDSDGDFFKHVKIDGLPAGLYKLSADGEAKSHAEAWVVVTNLGMVRKVYGSHVLALVTDVKSGVAQPDVAVTLTQNTGKVLHSGTTGEDGTVTLDTTGGDKESRGILYARVGDSVAAVSLELNSPGESGADAERAADATQEDDDDSGTSSREPIRAYQYTDRPIYRPGDTINFKGISRLFQKPNNDLLSSTAAGHPSGSSTAEGHLASGFIPEGSNYYSIPANKPVVVQIKDPQNNVVSRQTLRTNDMGSWNGSVTVSSEAVTGQYTMSTTVDGRRAGRGTFVVAAYHKPEYQVKITFDKTRYVRGDTLNATVKATYYFGAPVAGAQLSYSAYAGDSFASDRTRAPGPYRPVDFATPKDEDDNTSNSGEAATEGQVRLDDRGEAHIAIPTEVDQDQSEDQSYTFNADVTDSSNRSVNEQASATVGQGEIGLILRATPYVAKPNTPIQVEIKAAIPSPATATASGDELEFGLTTTGPETGVPNQRIEFVTAYQDWDNGDQKLSAIKIKDVTTGPGGTVNATVVAPHAGLFLIRAKTTDRRGNAIVEDSTVWVDSGFDDIRGPYPDLAVLLDKPKYNVGDTARVVITTSHPGPSVLVTLEGDDLYKTIVLPLTRRSTTIDIPVTRDLAPGVFVSVCALINKQFYASSEKLVIDDTQRRLKIQVSANAASYRPGDPATVTVHTLDVAGRPTPAEVSVAVVDSSIYAIMEDAPDDAILAAMAPDQGNIVDTDYSCPIAYLGDVDKGDSDVEVRSKFKDTAYWNADVRTDAGGQATVTFPLPDNLTQWRVTCVGHTPDTAVGKSSSAFTENKDLVARIEAPAFLVAGDASTLTGTVTNNTASSITAALELASSAAADPSNANAGGSAPGASPGLRILDPATQHVTVPAHGTASLTWSVAAAGPGTTGLTLKAWDTAHSALNDGLTQTLPVEPHAAHDDIWTAGSLIHNVDRTMTVDKNADPATSVLRLRLSPSVSSSFVPAWLYLSQYPSGSIDVTASILIGDSVLSANLNSLTFREGPGVGAARARLSDEVDRCALRLARYQRDDGGWGWFSTRGADPWMTAYAAWSLIMARDAGYPVKPALLKSAVDCVASSTADANRYWWFYSPSIAAISGLVLADAGNAKGAEAALTLTEQRWRDNGTPKANVPYWDRHTGQECYEDIAMAALAEHKLGGPHEAKARDLMRAIWAGRQRLGALAAWPAYPHAQSQGAEQDDPDTETTAWVMIAAEAITPNDPNIDSVARWIMANRNDDHWVCPRATATTLMALGGYLAKSHEMQPNFDASISVAGQAVKPIHFGLTSLDEPDHVIDIPVPAGSKTVPIHLEKSGQGRLYYSIDLRQSLPVGTPPKPMSDIERWYDRAWHPERLQTAFDPSGYHIKRVLLRDTSRRNFLWEDTVPAPGDDFRNGDDVIVRLIIDCTRPGSHLIVEEPIPAGCTIAEVSGDNVENWDNWWDYTDVRDDKIVFFISDLTRGRHEIDYHLRASEPGTYDIMPTLITGTFDPTLHALGIANRVRIE